MSMTSNPKNMYSLTASAIRFFKIVTSTNIQDGTLVSILSFFLSFFLSFDFLTFELPKFMYNLIVVCYVMFNVEIPSLSSRFILD